MKIISCLIVEDEEEMSIAFSEQLKRLLMVEITVAPNFETALSVLRSQTFDLIFLDVSLGDKSGLELLSLFSKLPPVIVFSAHSEFAVDSYDMDVVVDYVLKPTSDSRLLKAVNRALKVQHFERSIADTDHIFLKAGRKIIRFKYDEIDYVEAYGVYSKIFNGIRLSLVNESIANLDQILPSKLFKRVHKSYIINIQKITGLDYKYFFIGEIKIPIGISYKAALEPLMRLINNFQ